MKYINFLILFIFYSCSDSGKVTIVKQWHLAPGKDTSNIKDSKSVPQFENQVDIFEYLEPRINSNAVIVAEGCEGELDENENFNGWTVQKLKKLVNTDEFKSIMAPVFMKIKAKYPKAKVVCGDNLEDIEKNKLAFSDLRGFAGYYERLKQNKSNPEIFDRYKDSLSELAGKKMANPIEFARSKSLKALRDSKELIESRNLSFFKKAMEHKDKDVYIVIGGIHANHLGELLKKSDVSLEVYEPKGYSAVDQKLYTLLEEKLKKKESIPSVNWLEVPSGFSHENIPLKNLLKVEELANKDEWTELKSLMKSADLNPNILLSDYDKDGIRDFTVSTSGAMIIISAEDDDWDNDGLLNLLDSTWDKFKFPVVPVGPEDITNRFNIQGEPKEKLISDINSFGLNLLNSGKIKHDLLLLKVLRDSLSFLGEEKVDVKFFRASSPLFTYGKEVHFAYKPSSKTIDVYYEELFAKFEEMHEKHYSQKSEAELVKGYLLPLLYHSLSHELVHSMDISVAKISRKAGWTFEESPVQSKYLSKRRLKRKVITHTLENKQFKGKSLKDWIVDYKKADGGFLIRNRLPSFYSLEKPSEWVAEAISMCFMRKIFPKSKDAEEAKGFEQLLGINPSSMNEDFCKNYF